jgi:hypothetical protein
MNGWTICSACEKKAVDKRAKAADAKAKRDFMVSLWPKSNASAKNNLRVWLDRWFEFNCPRFTPGESLDKRFGYRTVTAT